MMNLALVFLSLSCAQIDLSKPIMVIHASTGIPAELPKLQMEFRNNVSPLEVEDDYEQWAKDVVIDRLAGTANMINDFSVPSQYFIFADRNPKKQLVMAGYYANNPEQVIIIGWAKCSTGNPTHGKDYHFTPTGVFANTLNALSFRAAGTKNSNGWRGYGGKNCRVWDFGYQPTTKPIRGIEQARVIRLLMHATDPDRGEQMLGTAQSKGCVRIPAKFNHFIDYYGLIDREYEAKRNNDSVSWLLLKNREPVVDAGKYLIIGDSAELEKK